MTEPRVPSRPSATEFPAPLEGEDVIFSVSCGNSHLHWATHHGHDQDYRPQIFWRTPHLEAEEITEGSDDLVAILGRNLPDDPHHHLFGSADDPTAADARRQAAGRAVPQISVYVVSTNPPQATLLARLWTAVPSRVHVLRGEHFFTEEEGRYPELGTDRCATLTGAARLHGHPALVFDGGTATTYSATDRRGRILGGGIGPGLRSRFRALARDADALPDVTPERARARARAARETGRPLSAFARTTREAIMTDAFRDFALKGRNVVEHWLVRAYGAPEAGAPPADAAASTVNTDRRVIFTGGDSHILMQLLLPHHGGIIERLETSTSTEEAGPPRYRVESSKHLIHYGIAGVLSAQVSVRESKEAFSKIPREEHVGRRVAKHSAADTEEGDPIFRGAVLDSVAADEGETAFRIQFDDGDSEEVSTSELFDMFKLYAVHGEKKPKNSKRANKASFLRQPSCEANTDSQRAKRATSSEDEKAARVPRGPLVTEKEKVTGALQEEKNTEAQRASAMPLVPEKPATNAAQGAPRAAENMVKAPALEKPLNIPSYLRQSFSEARDGQRAQKGEAPDLEKSPHVSSFPVRSAKKKAEGASQQEKKPAAKRAKTGELVNTSDPRSFVRKRISKDFDGTLYFGTIMEYDDTENPPFWHVEYDDGDEEDYSKKDLIRALKYYEVQATRDTLI